MLGPPVQPRHFHAARLLLVRYGASEGLRTLDALQLAIALDLKGAGQIATLVAADREAVSCRSVGGLPSRKPRKTKPRYILSSTAFPRNHGKSEPWKSKQSGSSARGRWAMGSPT